ncbi:SDR family NAD(P)-dependent oxidoreductase [Sphingobacterium sp. SRCM116780]|uniref:SDR family NAD(P)-dependent oxidoreductase n=1 Tax=Sphingobacterium sp. SRCM116780 TaxID=2907623 RepID=UPI001F204102|nr:SDR family NAD(P)-dependent oxidoreductase [Sphingobacterium sp. SRCM116780]UIR55500.1 SDR family NAD(P)-dependent oxidoreductase [Sphingobacterium sp. SRCM116780]
MKVFIAGGTAGIGAALANLYLAKGDIVAICGRDLKKSVIEHPNLTKYEGDVLDKDRLLYHVQDFVGYDHLDLFINTTGSYADDVARAIHYEESVDMLCINIGGTVNCFEVAREVMREHNQGQIVTIASVSGTLHYRKASLYSKSKRAVIQIADTYRKALQPFGITVTTIAPGYVDTQKLRDLNKQDLSKKPYLISEEEAAAYIDDAIIKRKELVVFPLKMKILMQFLSYLPAKVLDILMYKKAKWMKND